MALLNADLIAFRVFGLAGAPKIKYDPSHVVCVHGIPDDTECLRCKLFQEDLTIPDFDEMNLQPGADHIIASTYPPDMGDPQRLFTSMEDVAEFLLTSCAGLDIKDPQEEKTPQRFVRALRELTTPEDYEFTTFEATSDEMVTMYNIPFSSLCRHHVLPFTGTAHVAYIPNEALAGASKLARTVHEFSRALQTQEELTDQIATCLMTRLDPQGVAVIMEAEHSCMSLRGVKTYGTRMRTASMKGVFADHDRTAKAEFLSGINGR
jgi:GTP cyclohydrolase I